MIKEWYTARELAQMNLPEVPATFFGIRKKAELSNWEFRKKKSGKGFEYHLSSLPEAAQLHLSKEIASNPVVRSLSSNAFQHAPRKNSVLPVATEEDKQSARMIIVQLFEKFKISSNLKVIHARKKFVDLYNTSRNLHDVAIVPEWIYDIYPEISDRSLRRWRSATEKNNGLAPNVRKYGNRRGGGIIERAEKGDLKTYIIALILKQPHLTGGHLRDLCRARFGETVFVENLKTGVGEEKELPQVRTIERFVYNWRRDNNEIHQKLTNPDGHKNKYQLAIGRADTGIERLNQLWEIDASPADVLCADGRYSLYSIIDVWSRRLIFTVAKTASTEASLLIIRKAIMEWGVPEVLRTDNGSDFKSHQFVNAILSLGIKQDLCPPYAGEKKPFVERSFKTLQHDLMPLLPGYIGHSVADRKQIQARKAFAQRLGEKPEKAFCVSLTHEDIQAKIDQWVDVKYQHRPHKGLDGVTPFAKVASWSAPVRRIENERALDLLLAPIAGQHGFRIVGKKAIRLNGGVFWDSGLVPYVGKRVFVRCNPDDLGVIYCFTEDKEFICEAKDFNRAGVNPVQAASEAKKARKTFEKEQIDPLRKEMNRITPEKMADDILSLYARDNVHLTAFPKTSEIHNTLDIEQAHQAVSINNISGDGGGSDLPDMEEFKRQFEKEQNKITPQQLKIQDEERWYKRAKRLEALLEEQGHLDSEDQGWLSDAHSSHWYHASKNFEAMRGRTDKLSHQPEPSK